MRVHTWGGTSTRGKCPRLTHIVPIFLKEFWTLNIRLQNIQNFPGRQREICIENLFQFPPHAWLTLQLVSSLKPTCIFLSRGITDRKESRRDGMGWKDINTCTNLPYIRLSV